MEASQEKSTGISELRLILIIGCLIAAGLGIYLVLFAYEGVFHVAEIQTVVDQQCAKRVIVEWSNISIDPHLNWFQDGFFCNKATGEVVCFCRE